MIYFIGIKGTGMAALATMLYDLGYEVSGSDIEKHFFTQDELEKRGITILPFDPANIKDNYTVIIGNAFLEDFDEVKAARSNPTCKCYRYHEYLGELINKYQSICICGSHGKTTTTTMMANVLSGFKNTGYLIGDGEGYLNKDSEFICVESCEYQRHFLAYHPDYAIITNIEIDHVDYFKDDVDYLSAFQEFISNVKEGVFYCGDDPECQKLQFDIPHFSFGFNEGNDFRIINLQSDESQSSFDLLFQDNFLFHYNLPLVGKHLLLDALGVIALSTMLCFDHRMIENRFRYYESPKRRYKVEEFDNTIFIDDYAHHPTEIKVTINATRERFPDRKVIAIFKPHRASRVQYFANDFKEALSLADEIYLLDFTSIDDKQDGIDIDISYLANMLPNSHILSEDIEGAKILSQYKGDCLVFMSSKDIYNIATMTKELMQDNHE